MKRRKLNDREIARLRKYCADRGGQQAVAEELYTSVKRISNLVNKKTIPQRAFIHTLIELGIMDDDRGRK